MRDSTPKSVMSAIRRHKDWAIYLEPYTASMLKESLECDELKHYTFLIGFKNVRYKGELYYLGMVEKVLEDTEDEPECWYEQPGSPRGMLVL